MDKPSYSCHDCGNPTSGGYRCKKCHGAFLRQQAVIEATDRDRSILRMIDNEGLNGPRLATRLGISNTSARKKIILARHREEARQALSI